MAKLVSEDNEVRSTFELLLLKDKYNLKENISWVSYKLILESNSKKITYEKEKDEHGAGDYVFALTPINEIDKLLDGIRNLLEDETQKSFLFEPLEPSFELVIERSFKGFSAYVWVDAGNVTSDHYTWDGIGIRFFTTQDKIEQFLSELNLERRELRIQNAKEN